jgi:hypothetical protein
MNPIFKILFFSGMIILVAFSCENNRIEIEPEKTILGKWEIFEMGNWPKMEPIFEPTGYKEYLSDSILREYEYKTGNFFLKKYWIDSLLHEGSLRSDGLLITSTYNYQLEDDILRLDINAFAIFKTSIFKRIK